MNITIGGQDLEETVRETVESMFGGWGEVETDIGSSDISCAVIAVLREYYVDPKKDATEGEFALIRSLVRDAIYYLFQ